MGSSSPNPAKLSSSVFPLLWKLRSSQQLCFKRLRIPGFSLQALSSAALEKSYTLHPVPSPLPATKSERQGGYCTQVSFGALQMFLQQPVLNARRPVAMVSPLESESHGLPPCPLKIRSHQNEPHGNLYKTWRPSSVHPGPRHSHCRLSHTQHPVVPLKRSPACHRIQQQDAMEL